MTALFSQVKRLEAIVAQSLSLSRSEAKYLIRHGRVKVDGVTITQTGSVTLTHSTCITVDDKPLAQLIESLVYYRLHKPKGYVCSHKDDGYLSIFRLLKSLPIKNLHLVGRLDADTTGLVLLTNDGQWSQRITHPKRGCIKGYKIALKVPLSTLAEQQLTQGVLLKGESQPTLPARVVRLSEFEIELYIQEGRYHQVKRMLAAVNNRVEALHRFQIGVVTLDDLPEGTYASISPQHVQAMISSQ